MASILSQDAASAVYEPSIFDTALVASIYKTNPQDGTVSPVFPEALEPVLAHQRADGGWSSITDNFEIGCILNTMAGLLALMKAQAPVPDNTPRPRIASAEYFLRCALKKWDPRGDINLPAQLKLVVELFSRLEECGVVLHYPRRKDLEDLMRVWQGEGQPENHVLVSIVTQKEGYGIEVQPHSQRDCGVECSPAETALRLMSSDTYNENYEVYLRHAMEATKGDGCVPAVFPRSFVEAASVSIYVSCWTRKQNSWLPDNGSKFRAFRIRRHHPSCGGKE